MTWGCVWHHISCDPYYDIITGTICQICVKSWCNLFEEVSIVWCSLCHCCCVQVYNQSSVPGEQIEWCSSKGIVWMFFWHYNSIVWKVSIYYTSSGCERVLYLIWMWACVIPHLDVSVCYSSSGCERVLLLIWMWGFVHLICMWACYISCGLEQVLHFIWMWVCVTPHLDVSMCYASSGCAWDAKVDQKPNLFI